MVDLKIEGDLDDVNERQKEFVNDVLVKKGFKNGTVVFESFAKAGDNYMASMKRISVQEDGITLKMIAKFAPALEFMRTMAGIDKKYFNEYLIYAEILPKFVGLQKQANVPKIEQLRFPECYGTLCEDKNEVILLEDLKEANFVMLDRFSSLSDSSVRLVLKNLAIFHSLSFVLRKLEPNIYTMYANKLYNTVVDMKESEEMKMFAQQMTGMATMIVEDEYKNLILDTMTQLNVRAIENLKIDTNSKFSVIQHGDTWTNNFLVKIENDKPVECCLIDYQQSTVNSPVEDIYHLIFGCTDYETRSKNYQNWINYYHTELKRSLCYFKLDVEEIYPKTQFESDLKRHSKTGFGIGIIMNLMMLRESKDVSFFMEKMADVRSAEDIAATLQGFFELNMDATNLKERIEGLIKTVQELGYV